jgi:hypothetical protein
VRTRLSNRERIARAHLGGAGTRHFRTAFNIGLFDRNATPEEANDESSLARPEIEIKPFISVA